MSRFLWWAFFSPMGEISSTYPAVVLTFFSCLVGLCRSKCFLLRLHGVQCQLLDYRRVWSGKNCIGLCQSFQLVSLCLHPLHDRLDIFYCLMVLLWGGRWFIVDILHWRGVTPSYCSCYRSFLLLVRSVKKALVLCPPIEVRIFSSPLADFIVEHPRLCQNCDHVRRSNKIKKY